MRPQITPPRSAAGIAKQMGASREQPVGCITPSCSAARRCHSRHCPGEPCTYMQTELPHSRCQSSRIATSSHKGQSLGSLSGRWPWTCSGSRSGAPGCEISRLFLAIAHKRTESDSNELLPVPHALSRMGIGSGTSNLNLSAQKTRRAPREHAIGS
jgi:hypothetical protein